VEWERLREGSKRDSSTAQPDSFTSEAEERRRAAPVGMTGLGGWLWLEEIKVKTATL